MARTRTTKPTYTTNGSVAGLMKELWQAAVNLRGAIEPADYKRYVLPLIFLRFLSLRYERRWMQLQLLICDPKSEYYGDQAVLDDPLEYKSAGALIVPEEARWENIRKAAQADDIKIRLDNILRLLEDRFPDELRGLLPPVYAASNLDRENIAGLINLFSKDAFSAQYGGEDMLGRVYEYFIGEFASSEGKRGGEYFTPRGSTAYNDVVAHPDNLARPGDLLFAWPGSLNVYRWHADEALINQHIFKVIPHRYPQWFVHFHLREAMPFFQGIAADKATTMGHIKREHLKQSRFALPFMPIVAAANRVIEPLYSLMHQNERESMQLSRLRDYLLPKLMSGEIRVGRAEQIVEAAL
jgi:hypothetical protein